MRLGTYIGLHGKKPDLTVSDEKIEQILKKEQQENAYIYSIDHRPAAIGDEVVLDFTTTVDGEPVPGGNVNSYHLTLGSHRFIPGMEEGILEHETGDTFDLRLTFPSNYRSQELRNKEALFHVTVQGIYMPEYQPLDDDFALDYSEYDTLDEWRQSLREMLEERRMESAMELLSRELLTQVIEASEIPVDDDVLEEVTMELYDDFLDELDANRIPMALYCKRNDITEEQVMTDKRQEALEMISAQYVLHAIASEENLEVDPEQFGALLAETAADMDMTIDEFLATLDEDEIQAMSEELLMQAAMDFIVENAILE